MRASNGAAARLSQHVLHRNDHSHRIEPADDFGGPVLPPDPRIDEKLLESRRLRIEKIAEQMHFAPGSRHGKLAPAYDPNPQARTFRPGLGHSVDRIVIGERDRGQAERRSPRDDFRGQAFTV